MARNTHHSLRLKFNPEGHFGGFSQGDTTMDFYGRIAALLKPTDVVLDFGAGRGAQIAEDIVPYRRFLKTFKGRVSHVEGCDIDDGVMSNPYLDSAKMFEIDRPLPYDDNQFDLIYSNWVFEHVEFPDAVARELLRVLKPGGYICAITPNKFGYISIASRMISNKLHTTLLKKIQPQRKEIDVFPTHYRLNTDKQIKRYFGHAAKIVTYTATGDPAYHFNSAMIYGTFKVIHALSPRWFRPTLLIFMQKNVATPA